MTSSKSPTRSTIALSAEARATPDRIDAFPERPHTVRHGAWLISWATVLCALAVALYPIILVWALKVGVSPYFSYMGFGFIPEAGPLLQILVWFLAVLPGIFLPTSARRPSTIALWILYLLAYVPAQVVPTFASGRTADYLGFQFTLFSGFLLMQLLTAIQPIAIKRWWLNERYLFIGLCGFTLVTYAIVLVYFGLPTSIPGLFDVYAVRSSFDQQAQGAGIVLYLISWQSKVVNPFLMVYGVARKSWLAFGVGSGLQLVLYALAGHKSVLLSVALVMAVLVLYSVRGKVFGVLLSGGAGLLVIIGTLHVVLTDNLILMTLFVRRTILMPGLLTGYYQEYFSLHGLTRQFDPVTRAIFSTPYQEGVPYIIGRVYFNSPETRANANMWADAFASFGIGGVLFVSLILGLVLLVIDSLSIDRDAWISAVLVGIAAYSLVNSGLATSLSTHGILFMILLLFFSPVIRSRMGESESDSTINTSGRTNGLRLANAVQSKRMSESS